MIGIEEARRLAGAKLARKLSAWAFDPPASPALSLPLKPPTEARARQDQQAAEAWARDWSSVPLGPGAEVEWETRTWPSLGRQRVPVRLRLPDAASVAGFVGGAVAKDWRTLTARIAGLRDALGSDGALDAALRRHASEILRWTPERFDQVTQTAEWLVEHSVSGLRPRQLPIRGVDSKWFAAHRSALTSLHAAVTDSTDLGIIDSDRLVRVRFLDEALAPGGLADVAAPAPQLARLDIRPRMVVVLENLESLLALPAAAGVVALHGSGYAVDVIGDLPWLKDVPVLYWGDLDSHGFAILHRLRTHQPAARSMLMDEATLLAHRDLWVPEPNPTRAALSTLTAAEATARERLRSEGDVRLEQERIPWDSALHELRRAGLLDPAL